MEFRDAKEVAMNLLSQVNLKNIMAYMQLTDWTWHDAGGVPTEAHIRNTVTNMVEHLHDLIRRYNAGETYELEWNEQCQDGFCSMRAGGFRLTISAEDDNLRYELEFVIPRVCAGTKSHNPICYSLAMVC